MRKILKQLFLMAMAVVLSLSFMSVKVSAIMVTEAVNGGVATFICAVNNSGARAETQCMSGGAKVSVSATYIYEDKVGNRHTETSYVNDVPFTAQALFNPTSISRSLSLKSNHKVVIGGKTTEKSLNTREGEVD